MKIITCIGDRTGSGTFFRTILFSRTRIIDNFMNVFNGVSSPRVFSYRCVFHYFLTMPMGFNFKLTSSEWHQDCHCLQTSRFPS